MTKYEDQPTRLLGSRNLVYRHVAPTSSVVPRLGVPTVIDTQRVTFGYGAAQLCGGEATSRIKERLAFPVSRDRLLKEKPPTRSAEGRYITREREGRLGAATALRNLRWAAEHA